MKRLILAATMAASTLSGCATLTSPANCQRALSGLETASEIVAVLQARGVAPAVAAKIARALVIGQVSLAAACAVIPPAPVAGS